MKFKIINLIIGLPASGKTTWLKDKPNHLVFDDISQMENGIELLAKTIQDSEHSELWISDPNLCSLTTLKKAKEKIKTISQNKTIQFHYIIFERDAKYCLQKAKERNDGRKVESSIKLLYPKSQKTFLFLKENYPDNIEFVTAPEEKPSKKII